MPSDMYLRGKHDAEADAVDESFYQYYYDYRLAYDEVLRQRRRSKVRLFMARLKRTALWILPVPLLLVGGYVGYRQTRPGSTPIAYLIRGTPTPTAAPTPRPTLVVPTAQPTITPTPAPALRINGFAVVVGVSDAPLKVHTIPGKDTPAPGRLEEGMRVEILAGPQAMDGLNWWKIRKDEVEGWAAGSFLAPLPRQ
ncbi:MAG: hypothetical protein NVS4B8_29450 [Herpetosiphon sp.]